MASESARAPAGWGWRPGAELFPAPLSAADLPELPMLRFLSPGAKSKAIKRAIAEVPGLSRVIRPPDIQRRYGVAYATAYQIMQEIV